MIIEILNFVLEEDWGYVIVPAGIALIFLIGFAQASDNLRKAEKEIKKLKGENKTLTEQNSSLEAEKLKFKLQPHTLKNMMAKLQVVSKNLNEGMNSITETMNYIVYKGNNHFVSISEEIDFINKYISLNDLLSSSIDNMKFVHSVDSSSKYYNQPCIPHLISAYFIENAFKHGNSKHPDFLKIDLSLNKNKLEFKVVNKFKPVEFENENRGEGLRNMRKRLELLMPGKFDIQNSCNEEEYYATLTLDLGK